jgi:hypothetical protein
VEEDILETPPENNKRKRKISGKPLKGNEGIVGYAKDVGLIYDLIITLLQP